MAAAGRRDRWWVRGFALLGLVLCIILPLGAIGTIDASFDSSVAVPLTRSAGRHVVEPVERGPAGHATFDAAGDGRYPPSSRHALEAPVASTVAALLVTFVLLVLLTPAAAPLAGRPEPGLPRRRGPPSSW